MSKSGKNQVFSVSFVSRMPAPRPAENKEPMRHGPMMTHTLRIEKWLAWIVIFLSSRPGSFRAEAFEGVLRFFVALLGGFSIPFYSFGIVFFDAGAGFITGSEFFL